MRKSLVCLTVYTLGQGGADRVCAHIARGLGEAGFETELIVICAGGKGEAVLRELLGDRVRLTVLGDRRGPRWFTMLLRMPALVMHLRRARPDCIVSTGNNTNWLTTAARVLAGRRSGRLVLKMTNPIVRPHDSRPKRWLRSVCYRPAFRIADRVLPLSDAEAALLRRAYPRSAGRFATVFNPYVTPTMLAQPPAPQSGERVVLGIGRFTRQKQFDLLVRAFARIRTPSVRLVLAGDGAERSRIEALIGELGLERCVELVGFVPDIHACLARADLFVLSSIYEGLPAVVLEAMAGNCPVVSTDCFAAARDLLAGADGCEVVEATPDAMAVAIDRSLACPRPTTLRALAARYTIDEGVRSHVAHVRAVVAPPA